MNLSEEKKGPVKDLLRNGHRGKPEKCCNQYGETRINTPRLCLIDLIRFFFLRSYEFCALGLAVGLSKLPRGRGQARLRGGAVPGQERGSAQAVAQDGRKGRLD